MPHGGLCPPPVLPAASAHFLQDKAPPSNLLFFFFFFFWSPWALEDTYGRAPTPNASDRGDSRLLGAGRPKAGPAPGVLGPATRLPAFFLRRRSPQSRGICWAMHRVESVWGRSAPPTRAGLRVRRSEAPSATPPAVVKLGREGGGLSAYTSPRARADVLSLQNKPPWAAARLARGRPAWLHGSLAAPSWPPWAAMSHSRPAGSCTRGGRSPWPHRRVNPENPAPSAMPGARAFAFAQPQRPGNPTSQALQSQSPPLPLRKMGALHSCLGLFWGAWLGHRRGVGIGQPPLPRYPGAQRSPTGCAQSPGLCPPMEQLSLFRGERRGGCAEDRRAARAAAAPASVSPAGLGR